MGLVWVLWFLTLAALVVTGLLYAAKAVRHWPAVRRELAHPAMVGEDAGGRW